jgi:hypothetical protein
MMRLARRSSLAVVLLLASVGTASAECAWVLWGWTTDPQLIRGVPTQELYYPVSAHQTKDQCERQATSSRAAPEAKAGPRFQYNCLPDTIDPRGPKAK